jgi:hypothetical protein
LSGQKKPQSKWFFCFSTANAAYRQVSPDQPNQGTLMKLLQSPFVNTAAQRVAVALFAIAASGAQAQAKTEKTYLSGPSIALANKQASFSGGNFKANSAVTVVVKSPGGNEAAYSAVVDAEGKLVYAFVPTESGIYAVRVTGTDGKVLASSMVNAQR